MHERFVLRVQADEAEVKLLHAGNVPLQGFEEHLVAGRDICRAFERLLRAYENAVVSGLELPDDLLTAFEGKLPMNDEQGPICLLYTSDAADE